MLKPIIEFSSSDVAPLREAAIGDVIVSRECNLAMDQLNELICKQAGNIDRELEQSVAARRALGARLYALFMSPGFQGEGMFPVKRVCHALADDRKPKTADFKVVEQLLEGQDRERLDEWCGMFAVERELRERQNAVFQSSITEARRTIARLCSNADFRRALQLSGQRLLKQSNDYVQAVEGNAQINKALRQIEETLVSFLFRMALKPSPFGAFTDVVVHLRTLDKVGIGAAERSSSRVRFCCTSRMVLEWLTFQCRQLPQIKKLLPIRLNSTITRSGELVTFLSRYSETYSDSIRTEKLTRLPDSGYLRKLDEVVGVGNKNTEQLAKLLSGPGQSADEVLVHIEKLLKIGYLEHYFGIPDNVVRYSRAIAEKLDSFPGEDTKILAKHFRSLDEIELQYELAEADRRESLNKSFFQIFSTIVEVTNAKDPGLSQARTFMFEDVGAIRHDQAHVKKQFEPFRRSLADLADLLCALDDFTIERVAIYKFFNEQYPARGTHADFLDFYKRFITVDTAQRMAIMRAELDPLVVELHGFRDRWRRFLWESLRRCGSHSPVLQLDREHINQFLADIPESVRNWDSMAFYLQSCRPTHEGRLLVFNGCATGYGAMMSRFCTIFSQTDIDVAGALRADINRHFAGRSMVDLSAVLGMNTNLHPEILSAALEYPGSVAPKAGKTYRLNDLNVCADYDSRRLKLVEKGSNREMELRSLNLLLPAVGPNLYRFLHLFVPYINAKGDLWRRCKLPADPQRAMLPRLQIDNVVIARRTWTLAAATVPRCDSVFESPAETIAALEHWRASNALPHCVFYHFEAAEGVAYDWSKHSGPALKDFLQSKSGKPHYLDFRNPFLVRIFLRDVQKTSYPFVICRECLPHPEESAEESVPYSAREHIVQLHRA